ncbi:MAG: folylpolyglutamate synthase/dihydrofolate synthase family protein [Candidatus Omnitrophota bacterium]|nr:folylpolyglutamate synthase/dihydrofolate synthase family protein [Candidatus Omnitrophota bacterium]
MTSHDAKSYIESFVNYEYTLDKIHASAFNLQRVDVLFGLLGNPQNQLNVIHVAGSKGKGSTSSITASILQKGGYTVGLYTSPHLRHWKERIRILNRASPIDDADDIFADMISDNDLVAILERIKPAIEIMRTRQDLGHITFYEVLTVLAIVYFVWNKVDFVVLETGLGGRWDATNAVPSLVAAITPISLEHTAILGDTLDKIAAEKAAIIKEGTKRAVVAIQESSAFDVIHRRCQQQQVPTLYVGQDIAYQSVTQTIREQMFNVQGAKRAYRGLHLSLVGKHQLVNACVAIGVIESLEELGFAINPKAIDEGMAHVFWPCRWEIVGEAPFIILDGAHNDASIKSLVQGIQEIFPGKNITLVLGISQDKDRQAVCRPLNKIVRHVILTQAQHPRAYAFGKEEATILFPGKKCAIASNVPEAMALAHAQTSLDDVILVTGSLFVTAQARELLHHPADKHSQPNVSI